MSGLLPKQANVPEPKAEETESNSMGTLPEVLGVGAAMHLAPNIGMKLIKSTPLGNRALAGSMQAGIKRGQSGRMLHPNIKSALEYGVGPEMTVDYNVGQRIGKGINKYKDNPARQDVYLRRLGQKVDKAKADGRINATDVDKLPLLGSVKRVQEGNTSKRTEKVFDRLSVKARDTLTPTEKGVNMAMLGATGAADPTLLMQPALAGARKQLAKSELGKGMMQRSFERGLDGQNISKMRGVLTDSLISPGILDPQRVGLFANKSLNPAEQVALRKTMADVRGMT